VHIKKDSLICLGSDPVSTISIITGIIIFLLGITIFLIEPVLLKKGILQLARLYSVDGKIEEDTISYLNTMLMKIAPLIMLSSLIIFLYGFTWQYFSVRLNHIKALEPQSLYNCPILPFEVYYLISILILATVLRLHNINRGLEYDELVTAFNFVDTEYFWKTVSNTASYNHVANSILARVSQGLFGHHEWSLRLPAFILGLAGIYAMWIFTRHIFGKISAIIATFFLTISPIHVNYSATTRGYSGMILFSILSSHYFFKLLHHHSHRAAFIYILVNVCGLYFHLYFVFIVFVQIVWLLYGTYKQTTVKPSEIIIDKRTFQTLWVSFAIVTLTSILIYFLELPLILYHMFLGGQGKAQPLFILMVVDYLSGTRSFFPEVLTYVLIISGITYSFRSRPQQLSYFIALILFPVLLLSLLLCPKIITSRYFVFYLPYYILLLTAGFLYLWNIQQKFAQTEFFKKPYILMVMILFIVLTWHWLAISWTLPRDEGIRSAVKSMEQSNLETTSLCAIGNGYELYQYYTNKEIQIPNSYESFNELKRQKNEILCICNTSLTILPKHKEIFEFLQNHALSKRFGNCVVFHYRSDKML
jgi:hypothetical protein